MANTKPATADANFLRDALHKARLAEAAYRDAMVDLTDAQALRLQLLKDDLVPAASSVPAVEGLVDLALIPGLSPRLWIDPVSSVVMEPDPRTYRFIQDTAHGREIMLETADRAAMAERIKTHIAHRIVARERQLAGSATGNERPRGYSIGTLILAWVSGFSVGILTLFLGGFLLSRFGG